MPFLYKHGNEQIIEGLEEETTEQTLPAAGLGDTISSITSALGITPCEPCKRRAELLNKMFPWLKSKRELIEEEVDFIKKITSSNKIDGSDITDLFKLYNDIFNQKVQKCVCPGLISKMIQRLAVLVE
jgi:hypothetical protein